MMSRNFGCTRRTVTRFFIISLLFLLCIPRPVVRNPISKQIVRMMDKFEFQIPYNTFSSDKFFNITCTEKPSWINAGQSISLITQLKMDAVWDVFVQMPYLYVALAGKTTALCIYDISDLKNPEYMSCLGIDSFVFGVSVEGDYAYLATENFYYGFQIADVSNKRNPRLVSKTGSYGSESPAYLYLSGKYAYVSDIGNGLNIYSVENTSKPEVLSTSGELTCGDIECCNEGLFEKDNFVYIACGTKGLYVMNISDKAAPKLVSQTPTEGEAMEVFCDSDFAYVATDTSLYGLNIFNISTPSSPKLVSTFKAEASQKVFVQDDCAFLADASGYTIVDISDRFIPVMVGKLDQEIQAALSVFVDGNYSYVGDNNGGVKIIGNRENVSFSGFCEKSGENVVVVTAHDRDGSTSHSFVVNCEWTCGGILHYENTVCNGRGKCLDYNKCHCWKFIYSGKNCDSIQNLIIMIIVILGVMFVVSFLFCCYACFCCCCCICSANGCGLYILNRRKQQQKKIVQSILFLDEEEEGHENDPLLGTFTEFEGDQNGSGKIYLVDRSQKNKKSLLFEGKFKEGVKEGPGVEYFLPLDEEQDNRSQEKVLILGGKTKFEGNFSLGQRHGRGKEFSRFGGKSFEGTWKRGKLTLIDRDFVDLEVVSMDSFSFDPREDRIGEGSEGTVYRVMYRNEEAALKILKGSSSVQFSMFQRFQRLMMAKNLIRSQMIWSKIHDHANILRLYCWSGVANMSSQPLGYCMQKCEFSLKDVIEDPSLISLTMKVKIRILVEISQAMEYMHDRSIMHRDIKPENILIDKFDHAQICDFEFARYDDDWRVNASKKSVLGTPAYVAPDIILGRKYTRSCDVYSFGILVFCVYFGETIPFSNVDRCEGCGKVVNPAEIATHVARCSLRPSVMRPHPSDDLLGESRWLVDEIMSSCVKSSENERPTFKEILKMFTRFTDRSRKRKSRKGRGKTKKKGTYSSMDMKSDQSTIN